MDIANGGNGGGRHEEARAAAIIQVEARPVKLGGSRAAQIMRSGEPSAQRTAAALDALMGDVLNDDIDTKAAATFARAAEALCSVAWARSQIDTLLKRFREQQASASDADEKRRQRAELRKELGDILQKLGD